MNFTVYSKNGCPKCDRAIAMIRAAGVEPKIKKLENGDFTVDDFISKFDSRSLPGIDLNGENIAFETLPFVLA